MSSSPLNLDEQNQEFVQLQEQPQELGFDTNTDNNIIYLISKEAIEKNDLKLSITKKQAFNCKLFRTAIENDSNATDILVSEIKQSILMFIVEFLIHYDGKEIPMPEKPARSEHMKDNTTEWNANFIDRIAINKADLYALISAANFIDCEGLLHLACCKVASMIKNIPLAEIKNTLLDKKEEEKKEN
jgi:hypothetical protein